MKETERRNLAERFDIPKLELFSANITLRRRDGVSIVVEGSIEAHIRFGEQLDIEKISNSFDTLLLNNFGRSSSGTINFPPIINQIKVYFNILCFCFSLFAKSG